LIDLDAIEAMANAATKWPWVTSPMRNMDFVAHAREDIPALVAEVRKLKVQLDAAIEACCADHPKEIAAAEAEEREACARIAEDYAERASASIYNRDTLEPVIVAAEHIAAEIRAREKG